MNGLRVLFQKDSNDTNDSKDFNDSNDYSENFDPSELWMMKDLDSEQIIQFISETKLLIQLRDTVEEIKKTNSNFQVPTKVKFSNVKGPPGQGKADAIIGIVIAVEDKKAGRRET